MIGVLVSGHGSNLQALLDEGLPIVAVASNKPGVRALARAEQAGVTAGVFELAAYMDREQRDVAMANWLAERGVELVVLAGYMPLLTEPFLSRFPERIVNVHPSLLPAFPGAHAIADALAAGVHTTGVTVHVVDAGLDSGPVLATRATANAGQAPRAIAPRQPACACPAHSAARALGHTATRKREARGEPGQRRPHRGGFAVRNWKKLGGGAPLKFAPAGALLQRGVGESPDDTDAPFASLSSDGQ